MKFGKETKHSQTGILRDWNVIDVVTGSSTPTLLASDATQERLRTIADAVKFTFNAFNASVTYGFKIDTILEMLTALRNSADAYKREIEQMKSAAPAITVAGTANDRPLILSKANYTAPEGDAQA